MSKPRVVIASVLKPVDDTRMFEKFAFSLAGTGKVEIHVLGFKPGGPIPGTATDIHLHPLFSFTRLSWKRLFAPWRYFNFLIKVKPELVIVNTHELLIVSILNQILFGSKTVYDVRENYFRNILFTNSFPMLIKPFLAAWVRSKEIMTRPWISHYFLAEVHYEKEFWFARGKSTVIQNKYQPMDVLQQKRRHREGLRFLFSGTIAHSTGIFESIRLVEALYNVDDRVTLAIAGYCAKNNTLRRIKSLIASRPYIRIIGGDELVPHQKIADEINRANFGLMCYPANESTKNTLPTKLFEYIGHRLPILLHDNEPWRLTCEKYEAAVIVNYYQFDPPTLLQKLKQARFYPEDLDYSEIYWESEATKLTNRILALLKLV